MNERVTVNGAVFFVGWRLTPYQTYRSVALLSAMRAGKLPDGGALRLIRATVPYISNGYSTPQVRASAAPPGKLYQTPFPSLCRMAATPYPAYLHPSSKACASRGILNPLIHTTIRLFIALLPS